MQCCSNAEEMRSLFNTQDFDIAILSAENNNISNLQLIKDIKNICSCYSIVISNSNLESMLFLSYELGCDDYIRKPFSYKEFSLRIKRILERKSYSESRRKNTTYRFENNTLQFNKELSTVRFNQEKLRLTMTEYRILALLADNCGRTVGRDVILKKCFDIGNLQERIVDSHIKNIRAKFHGKADNLIITIRNNGYMFNGKLS